MPRHKLSICLALAAMLALPSPVRAADDSLFSAGENLIVRHLTTGPDQRSRLDTMPLALVTGKYGLKSLIDAPAERVKIGVSPDGLLMDFHVALHRTLLIQIQGILLVDIGDGALHRLPPGSVVLAEDRTGRGHKSGCESRDAEGRPGQCMTMQINLDDAGVGLQVRP